MDYQNKKFSVPVGTDAYRDGWERVFGKKEPPPRCCAVVTFDTVRREGRCLLEEGHEGGHFPEAPPGVTPGVG